MKNHYKTEIKKKKNLSLKFHVNPETFEAELFWGGVLIFIKQHILL